MRSYNILKEKVARFHADPEIREILRSLEQRGTTPVAGVGPGVKYDRATATALKAHSFDAAKQAARGYEYERLDQLTVEVLLGVR
jgi:xylose isomerase